MSGQVYTQPLALERLRRGACPECGAEQDAHGGWGGPGCLLTDGGVAQRVATQRELDDQRGAVRQYSEAGELLYIGFPLREPREMTAAERRAEDEEERRLHDEAADDHEHDWRTR